MGLLTTGLLGTPALAQEGEAESDTTMTDTTEATTPETTTETAETTSTQADTTDQDAMQEDGATSQTEMSADAEAAPDSSDAEVAGSEAMESETVALLRTVGNPLRRADMLVFVMPTLSDTLGLTEQQAQQLDQMRSDFAATRAQTEQELQDQQMALVEQLRGTNPPASELEGELQRIAQLRVETQLSGYRTLQDMLDLLNAEQQETVASLTPAAMQNLMMRNMTMMEARQMMQALRGNPSAIEGGTDGERTPEDGTMQDDSMQDDAMQDDSTQNDSMNESTDETGTEEDGMEGNMEEEGMDEDSTPAADTTSSENGSLR